MWWLISICCLFPAAVYCFQPVDLELFKLQRAITEDIGPKANFYNWLGVKKSASNQAIVSAYRKLSRKIHPDRSPAAGADARFARLNQVHKTLRSSARERYDYYLSKGFPRYDAATDTYYNKRYRPSLMFAVILIIALGTGVEFLVKKLTAHRRREQIKSIIADAIEEAKKESDGVISSTTKVELRPKQVFYVHADHHVTFEGLKLSPELVEEPTWKDLALVSFVLQFVKPQADTTQDVPETVEEAPEEDLEIIEEEEVKTTEKAQPEVKKGAARRRAPGARGKARVF